MQLVRDHWASGISAVWATVDWSGIRSGISVHELISTLKKKKKAQMGDEWSNILPKCLQARKKPPHFWGRTLKFAFWCSCDFNGSFIKKNVTVSDSTVVLTIHIYSLICGPHLYSFQYCDITIRVVFLDSAVADFRALQIRSAKRGVFHIADFISVGKNTKVKKLLQWFGYFSFLSITMMDVGKIFHSSS